MQKHFSKTVASPLIGLITWVLIAVTVSSCQSGLLNPPRAATATAQAALPSIPTNTPLIISAPTTTPGASQETEAVSENITPNPVISIWINETSLTHEQAVETLANEFTAAYQIDVELMFISPLLLPDLVSTAVLSNTLPDIIIHPLEYSIGWAERGVFNLSATQTALEQLGPETFNPEALNVLNTPAGLAALPSDGYAQLLVYRQDWVEQRGLAAPTNFTDMFNFAEATFDGETFITAGFVIPTESNLVSTHQAFEQIAQANGCDLVTISGEVDFLSQACLDALNFYFDIVHNFSPPGIQTASSTQNAYLDGRTGMIMISSAILPMMAGLDAANMPLCDECLANPAFLAENSQIVTQISASASSPATGFSTISSLGITRMAQPETAVLFANYWFNEGYPQWLDINSERKVPMRWGTPSNLTQFIDSWGQTPLVENGPSLFDLYGETAVNELKNNVTTFRRWGFSNGQGELITALYEDLTIAIVLQEMLSGYFDTSQTSFEAYNRIVELIPNYQFPIIEPTVIPQG